MDVFLNNQKNFIMKTKEEKENEKNREVIDGRKQIPPGKDLLLDDDRK